MIPLYDRNRTRVVPFWAHIGGFVAGAGYMKLLRGGQPPGSGRYVRFRRVV